jgi:hypothetical protein
MLFTIKFPEARGNVPSSHLNLVPTKKAQEGCTHHLPFSLVGLHFWRADGNLETEGRKLGVKPPHSEVIFPQAGRYFRWTRRLPGL